jgi:hypothetical protein
MFVVLGSPGVGILPVYSPGILRELSLYIRLSMGVRTLGPLRFIRFTAMGSLTLST